MMRHSLLAAICLAMILVGCETKPSASSGNDRGTPASGVNSEYLLSEKPTDAVALTDAAESLGTDSKPLTLIGKIDAGDFSAFEESKATFMLSELPADGHGVDDPDHADNCPFCKRRAANAPKAIVQIVDVEGNVIPTDARQLLGVQQGDKVIASGEASYDETVNAITVKCEKVYLLR